MPMNKLTPGTKYRYALHVVVRHLIDGQPDDTVAMVFDSELPPGSDSALQAQVEAHMSKPLGCSLSFKFHLMGEGDPTVATDNPGCLMYTPEQAAAYNLGYASADYPHALVESDEWSCAQWGWDDRRRQVSNPELEALLRVFGGRAMVIDEATTFDDFEAFMGAELRRTMH